ncbi:MAG: efflux RND transporter periplasmic adaptor subunit [Paludibacter sp.]|nr:efflux RND transporter periplasmic adaptor subunit [Paludibacter sp.]
MKNRILIHLFFISTLALVLSSCGGKKQESVQPTDNSGKKIVETGELAAIDSRSFILPRFGRYWWQMKIIGIQKHGTIVKAGDSIIQLDPTDIKKFVIDMQSQLETQTAVLAKLRVDQNNKIQELDSKLKSETATFNLKKLELEAARFESDRIKKIKQLEFNQAKIEFSKIQNQMKWGKIFRANEMKIELIKANQMKSELKDANEILPKLTIRTPISGIFQVGTNWRTGDLIKIGDQIYPGNNMGNVPDLTWMKVNTTVGERDFLKISKGQKVVVRLDAMPKVRFDGEVSYIGKLCHLKNEKSRQKVFDVEVRMLKSDERLKPGMTVSCEYK